MLIVGTIALAFVVGVVHASFFEWAFHRFWLHRPWLPDSCFRSHTMIHHQLCKYEDTFHVVEEEQEEALHFQWFGGPVLTLINTVPWMLVSFALWAAGIQLPYVAFCVTFASTVMLYYLGYEGFHYLMHKPRFPWIERAGFFKFLKKHHELHHVYMDKNLNVLFPLADFFLGSLMLVAPRTVPRVTGPNAKVTARKFSNYGRKLREQGIDTDGAEERTVASQQ